MGAVTAIGTACSSGSSIEMEHVRSATAITQVYGEGQKLIAVGIEYDSNIDTTKLATSSFTVTGRTVTKVYANTSAAITDTPVNGPFVIVELSPTDSNALLWAGPEPANGGTSGSTDPSAGTAPAGQSSTPASQDPSVAGPPLGSSSKPVIKSATATVSQTGAVTTTAGTTYAGTPTAEVTTTKTVDPLVDLFEQKTFSDATTGQTLQYNLFVPKNYSPARKYPLVLFMHDASVVGADVKGTLVQGLGAVCWASPEDQARHECFVVAPQYQTVVVSDDYNPGPLFETTVNLINTLTSQYSIDTAHMHATGQSMGAMMTLGLNIRHPDLFSTSYVVAGQWPSDQAAPLAHKRLWVTVSQGDAKAYPMGNETMAVVQDNGGQVTTATWDARATQAQFATAVDDVTSKETNINYVSFLPGTVPSTGGGASEHMGTWQIAYSIPGIRDWVMQS
ncbi:hypothetical protein [Gordonia pseudamarae]|uniref:hypothetical protein n=1 Tax=Gordonia pseudamarae TaxID=2831662 RepID=UPI001FE31E3F|nr:hypothetical protein [Gordonia pseudamarae]